MIYPEIFLFIFIIIIIIFNILITKIYKYIIIYLLSLFTLFICSFFIIKNIYLNNIGYIFFNLFIIDELSNVLKLITFIITIIIFFFFYIYNKKKIFYTEFYIIVLFSILGQMIVISSNNLLSLYLGLELMSISLYVLISINFKKYFFNDLNIKYFIINIILSAFFLYGSSLIYGMTGVLEINKIFYKIIFLYKIKKNKLLLLPIIFIMFNLLFKIGIFPFHILIPDIYKKSSISIISLINYIPKLAIFSIIFHILLISLFILNLKIQKFLMILSLISIIISSISLIKKNNIKYIIAYSSIFNIGFLILNISYNNINIYEYITSYSISLYYIIIYIYITSCLFGLILNIKGFDKEKNNIINFNKINNSLLLNICTLILILSLSGIPPFLGFYLKLFVFKNIFKTNNIYFILIIFFFSLINIIYILKIIKNIFFYKKNNKKKKINFFLLINILILIIITIFPNFLINFCYKIIINSFSFILLNNISYGAGGN